MRLKIIACKYTFFIQFYRALTSFLYYLDIKKTISYKPFLQTGPFEVGWVGL